MHAIAGVFSCNWRKQRRVECEQNAFPGIPKEYPPRERSTTWLLVVMVVVLVATVM